VTARGTFVTALIAAWALDVITKVWAASSLTDRSVSLLGGRLLLRESRNTGAAFSIGTGITVLISLIGIAVVLAILVYVRRVSSRTSAIGLGLVAGGALGNLTDRLLRSPGPLRGGVVDWLDLGWFPSFNAADSAITVGAGLVLLASVLEERRARAVEA
jgi:signal peptidase II